MKKAEEFKDFVVGFFDRTKKTGWGKKEISRQMMGLWSEFLMKHVQDQQGQAAEEFGVPIKEPPEDAIAPPERESTTAIDELRKSLESED